MFKENFIRLCNQKGESPSSVCRNIGIAPATFSCWTNESVPRQSTLLKIAEYFGVTVEDLLFHKKERSPIKQEEFDEANELLAQIAQEIKSLDDEGRKELENYVAYLVSKKKKG